MNDVDQDNSIRLRGVRVHNLKSIDLDIPRDALVVITGISGSGKSSLAFDTLFAEGQRRYLESLSTYTRQFLNQLERPDVDLIDGLPPTVSIEQRAGSVQRRSTLATTTEIYDYLRLLYARAGQAHCPQCGREVARQSSQRIVERILALEDRRKVMILAPLVRGRKGAHREVFERIAREALVRARVDGEIVDVSDPPKLAKTRPHTIEAVVDRIIIKEGIRPRLQESVDLALKYGDGACLISYEEDGAWHDRLYSEKFACPDCEISFPNLEPRTFSFNSPYGACPECQGMGVIGATSEPPGPARRSGGVKPRRSPSGELPFDDESEVVTETSVCPACNGARLNAFARSVTVGGVAIHEFTAKTVGEANQFARELADARVSNKTGVFSDEQRRVAARTVPEVANRLAFLVRVGLDYLTLDRPTRTLSGGEFQRARLAGCLGSGLIGVAYILDEPTIGLHPRDTGRLIGALEDLRDGGNSVLVVEHDVEMMRRADWIVDLGPGAGREGGNVVAAGPPAAVAQQPDSLTGRVLRGSASALVSRRRPVDPARQLVLTGARRHNLKNVTLQLPLGVLTCVTGVSGSGKSSLISQTLVPAVKTALVIEGRESPGHADFASLEGVDQIERVIQIDQSPIGRTGRSNPATYSGMWDEVRKVFAQTREARLRGYPPRRFSFNSKQGRCEECQGHGTQKIEMHFMPDVHVPCPVCRGARFNRQTLAIRFAGKNVADVLDMRIDDAAEFFENFSRLDSTLRTFSEVGLGYLRLGQSSLTLSGGEAQRVKLATELSRASSGRTLFVLDEPTTGLHPADVEKLLALLQRLVNGGHTVLVIEHQLDVIAAADWIVDMGPEGGAAGGEIIAAGPPDEIARTKTSPTALCLREYLSRGWSSRLAE